MNRTLLLHFLKFDISSQSLSFEPWLDALYVSNDVSQTFPARQPTLKLQVEDAATSGVWIDTPALAVFAETNLCNARCYYESGRFYSSNLGNYPHELVYDLRTHTIVASLGGRYVDNPQFIVGNILRPILQSFVMPFYGMKTLHGAVLNRGDQTLFLAGAGGAGKTTAAIELMGAGYDLLSDDGPFFVLEGGRAYALASLDYLHVTETTLALFPQLCTYVIGEKDGREKYAVPTRNLQNLDGWKKPQQVTEYIQLRRTHVARPRLQRRPKLVAHRQLMRESMIVFRAAQFRTEAYPFREYGEFTFEVVASLVQNAEVYELEYADDHLAELPALLEQL